MKTTLITTCLNEEKTIRIFLNSVFSQTVLPDEIIVVDACSKDRTVERIRNHTLSTTEGKRLKIISKKGNRSVGRNEAIKHAKNEIILCSDVGCILDKNWVKNITEPFSDSKIDVVSGYYKPITQSAFEKCLASYTCIMPDKVDPNNFLPSSRSVAFKKSTWKTVDGFPEKLNTCEDLIFDKKLKEKGFQFIFIKNAIVFWPQRKNLQEAFLQFYLYAVGDGKAHYFRKSTPFLFGRYALTTIAFVIYFVTKASVVLNLLIIFLLLYIVWSIAKNYRYVQSFQALLYLPMLQFSSDLAVMSGITLGILQSL